MGYLMIGMALGQACLAIGLSWIASRYPVRDWADYRAKVELPLWFAILPALTAAGVGAHMWLSRHKDRTCPWVGLGWIVLVANIIALMLFMTMTL